MKGGRLVDRRALVCILCKCVHQPLHSLTDSQQIYTKLLYHELSQKVPNNCTFLEPEKIWNNWISKYLNIPIFFH